MCECGRAGLTTCMSCSSMGKGEIPSPPLIPHCLWQVRNLAPGSEEQEIKRAVPVPHLLQYSGEQALHLT